MYYGWARLFEYSLGGLAFDFQFWDSNIIILFFFEHLASPAKRFLFALEYESPTSERHDSVHLEEKTKMPKTLAVWEQEHFKLSEDTTKAVCQICDLKLA